MNKLTHEQIYDEDETDGPPACECDNTHEHNDTVCRWCWAHGRRHWGDPAVILTREQIYDDQINPLMAQIIDIAQAHDIPMFATFQLTTDADDPEHGPMFCETLLCPEWGDRKRFKALHDVATGQPEVLLMSLGLIPAPREQHAP